MRPGSHFGYIVAWRLNRWAAYLAGLTLLFMALIGALDVIATRFFGWPIPGTVESTETMMVACIFLAIALAQQQGRHIRVEIVVSLLGRRAQASAGVLAALVTCILFTMIAWFGWKSAAHSVALGEFKSGLIDFPMWPARLTLALGATLMVLQSLIDLFVAVRSLVTPPLAR